MRAIFLGLAEKELDDALIGIRLLIIVRFLTIMLLHTNSFYR